MEGEKKDARADTPGVPLGVRGDRPVMLPGTDIAHPPSVPRRRYAAAAGVL